MVREEIRSIGSTRRDLRNFGLVVGIAFCLLGGLLLWRNRPAWPYLGGAGLTLMLLGLAAPSILKPFQKAWMTLAILMGWVMTRVILCLLFFLVLTPIALIARVAGHAFIDRSPGPATGSYWNRRDGDDHVREHYERQF
jgi:hypothetical protein